ncbi:MAG: hypothetical protein IJY61_03105 [Candidatus Gastranaerophilales bacterium]|nr:hypothetical protein [Candidatus Gastranaerophilales bacterium]
MTVFDAITNQGVSVVNNQVKKEEPKKVQQTKLEYKPDILDICSEKIINKRDITDTVTMPRAIFKGYLCFTAGTAINAISGMLKKGKTSKVLGIAGSLISILGTFNFVKPFLIPEKQLTKEEK